jgi:hypothetical protein
MPRSRWTVALLLCAIVTVYNHAGASDAVSRDVESWPDNRRLPLGNRVAVIVSGLGKRGVLEHALHSLQKNVVEALGRDNVHVFVHTEPSESSFTTSEVLGILTQHLSPANLRGYVINVPGTIRRGRMYGAKRWTAGRIHIQFDRLRDAFQLVLAEEQVENERYAWICRVRTDTIWLLPWSAESLRNVVPQNKTVAGPYFDLHGHRRDIFWIASRDAAWLAFALVPNFFLGHMNKTDMWNVLSCDARTAEDDWRLPSAWTRMSLAERGCETCIEAPQYGFCPEVVIPFALLQGGLHLTDSCQITGVFVTTSFHYASEITCKPDGAPSTRRVQHSQDGSVTMHLKQVESQEPRPDRSRQAHGRSAVRNGAHEHAARDTAYPRAIEDVGDGCHEPDLSDVGGGVAYTLHLRGLERQVRYACLVYAVIQGRTSGPAGASPATLHGSHVWQFDLGTAASGFSLEVVPGVGGGPAGGSAGWEAVTLTLWVLDVNEGGLPTADEHSLLIRSLEHEAVSDQDVELLQGMSILAKVRHREPLSAPSSQHATASTATLAACSKGEQPQVQSHTRGAKEAGQDGSAAGVRISVVPIDGWQRSLQAVEFELSTRGAVEDAALLLPFFETQGQGA